MKKQTWGNPYTHEEHTRICYTEKDYTGRFGCSWCGRKKKRLYSYDNLTEWWSGSPHLFCNKDCFLAYTK